jgi:uncharacterized membrane protein
MQSIELVAKGLEYCGVVIITISFVYATLRSLWSMSQRKEGVFETLKIFIGKALQLGLEFLVAADIIRTVIIEPSRQGIALLGLLIVVRTFLSWSITVEIEGCWPWQVAKIRKG